MCLLKVFVPLKKTTLSQSEKKDSWKAFLELAKPHQPQAWTHKHITLSFANRAPVPLYSTRLICGGGSLGFILPRLAVQSTIAFVPTIVHHRWLTLALAIRCWLFRYSEYNNCWLREASTQISEEDLGGQTVHLREGSVWGCEYEADHALLWLFLTTRFKRPWKEFGKVWRCQLKM